jgi:hypothetical protein
MTYYYAWRNNAKRATLYRRHCRIVARLAFNSAVVEFENGQRECISRNALRKIKSEVAR